MARRFFERFIMCMAATVLLLSGSIPASCVGSHDKVAVVGDTIPMRHSSLLTMVECDGYTVVDVKNPWKAL